MTARRGYRQCSRCERNRAEKFFKPKGRVCFDCQKKRRKTAAHDRRVSKTYGLNPGEWEKLYEAQGGVCAICGRETRYKMDTDHDHKTGLVRGLVCRLHNRRLLPAAGDSPEILRAAADYLENPIALRVLGERYFNG
jgi:hypothetical protein